MVICLHQPVELSFTCMSFQMHNIVKTLIKKKLIKSIECIFWQNENFHILICVIPGTYCLHLETIFSGEDRGLVQYDVTVKITFWI